MQWEGRDRKRYEPEYISALSSLVLGMYNDLKGTLLFANSANDE